MLLGDPMPGAWMTRQGLCLLAGNAVFPSSPAPTQGELKRCKQALAQLRGEAPLAVPGPEPLALRQLDCPLEFSCIALASEAPSPGKRGEPVEYA